MTDKFRLMVMLMLVIILNGNKVSSYEAAITRYGIIDKNGTWADSHKWLVKFSLRHFPTLKLRYKGTIVHNLLINRDMTSALTGAFNCIINNNLEGEIKQFNGVWNIRPVTGKSNQWSAHAYGLAIDLNAHLYPYGTHGRQHPKLIECFTDQGFTYGINFDKPDPHHFSYSWE